MPGGPWKPYDESLVGSLTQALFAFLDKELFAAGNAAIRNNLLNAPDEHQLRLMLGNYGIFIPALIGGPGSAPLRIMLVDVQSTRTWQDPNQAPINAANDYFYLLVMPPVPTRYDPTAQPGYEKMQAWESAWYHAIVDGYGM
jgi:hypothetical protein